MTYYERVYSKCIDLILIATALLTILSCDAGQGPQGNPGPQGPAGSTGSAGSVGSVGAQGPAGANGTIITVIQFCPGVTPSTSNFPEVGLCINNNVYGILNNNVSYQYLTELTPQAYSSAGQGAPCSFTLLPNCVVTP